MRSRGTWLWACLIVLAVAGRALPQSTFATITGNVADPSGAAVPGATVEARNVRTGYVYTATSNDEGVYTLANLLDGTYQLKARAQGFGEFAVDNIILTVRENRRVDVLLQVGAMTRSTSSTRAWRSNFSSRSASG